MEVLKNEDARLMSLFHDLGIDDTDPSDIWADCSRPISSLSQSQYQSVAVEEEECEDERKASQDHSNKHAEPPVKMEEISLNHYNCSSKPTEKESKITRKYSRIFVKKSRKIPALFQRVEKSELPDYRLRKERNNNAQTTHESIMNHYNSIIKDQLEADNLKSWLSKRPFSVSNENLVQLGEMFPQVDQRTLQHCLRCSDNSLNLAISFYIILQQKQLFDSK